MKKMNVWFLMSLIATMVWSLSACSSDDPIVPEFPDKEQTIDFPVESVEAGTTSTLNFTANMDWKLSSNKTWLTMALASDGSTIGRQDISGTSGSHTVTLYVGDDNWDFDNDKAQLTLSMGTESKVIATVTRAAKPYELNIFDSEGNEIETIAIGTSGEMTFEVEANFSGYAVTAWPAWLEEPVVSGGKVPVAVKADFVKYPQSAASDVITIANESGDASFSFPVTYAGMDPFERVFNPSTTWGVKIAADGMTYTNALNAEIVNEAPYKASVATLNDEYTLFYYKYDNKYGMSMIQTSIETPWFTVDDDKKGNLTISFSANSGASRKGYLFVIPTAFYETLTDIDAYIVEDMNADVWEMSSEAEKYLLAEFSQEAAAGTALPFDVLMYGYMPLAVTKVTDAATLEYVAGECMYSGEEVYTVSADPGSWLQIFPNLSEDVWNCEIYPMILGVTEEQENAMGYEGGVAEDDRHYMGVTVPDVTAPIYIAFRDNMWQFHKVLIITPY